MDDRSSPPESGMLVELSRISDRDLQEVYIWRHPRLLEPGVAETLAAQAPGAARQDRKAMSRALDRLREIRQRYEAQPKGYAIGAGPIEEIWQLVETRQISAAEGERQVSAPDFTTTLSARYLRSLAEWSVGQAVRGAVRQALQTVRLVHAAAQAADTTTAPVETRAWIAVAWLEAAKLALNKVPDGRLLAEARSIGEAALAAVGADGGWQVRSALLFGLGTLYLDPYFAGVSSPDVEERLESWQRRGALRLDLADEEPAEMPMPVDALITAEAYLRQALGLKPFGVRASTQKALAEVLAWRIQLGDGGDGGDHGEIVELCRLALADLGEQGSVSLRMSLLNLLAYFDEPIDAQAAAPVLDRPLDDLVDELGVGSAVTVILTAARVILQTAPRKALDGLVRARPLLSMGTEEQRSFALGTELAALAEALAPGLSTNDSVEADLAEMTRRADAAGWNGAARAAAMMRIANRSSQTDEEHLGLDLLDRIARTSPIVATEHDQLLAFLRTNLQLNMGVNAYEAKKWAECAQWYARALSGWLDLGFDDRGLQTLLRVADIVGQADTPVEVEFVLALAPNAARIETRLGDGATTVIQDMVKEALAKMDGRPINPAVMHLLFQIAKGARLAPVLASGLRYDPAGDQYAGRLLAAIGELRAQLSAAPGVVGTDPEILLDEDTILTAYARQGGVEGGATPEERLSNLERAYDEHITRQMLVATGDQSSVFMSLEDVQARLGDRTVLVSLYLGVAADEIAVYVLYMTSEEVHVSLIPHGFPSSTVLMGNFLVSPFALLVGAARQDIQDPPLGRRLVSRVAEEKLDHYLGGLLGHLSLRLQEFKAAGHDHLCIVPHGPYHFFPFHLLGPPGHPLAEDFAVTYLPQLHLLAPGRVGGTTPRGTALGLGFAADLRPGLVPLPEAVPEAREIAALLGGPALVEQQATEEATIAALQDSGVVHLATHGRHNVDAPAFQTLYLHPARGSDGRLQAHELLGLDLRGMRLLTLSACETALGRFDGGDNIRGLPASFFIAGVSALVGTLWRVRDAVSRHFFTTFYRSYLGGTALLDAFVAAQRQTRAQFPQYRDWGAFYFAGDWTEPHDRQEGQ